MAGRATNLFSLRRSLLAAAPLGAFIWGPRGRSLCAAAPAGSPDHFDLLVIGGGSGGLASARRAALYGKKVAVVERGATWDENGVRQGAGYGGTCVNVGCVPKKLMYTAASHFEAAETASGYAITMAHPTIDWVLIKKKRDAYLARLNGIYTSNMDKASITHIEGFASFTKPKEVNVGDRTLSADHVVIAVGGKPSVPPIPGESGHLTPT